METFLRYRIALGISSFGDWLRMVAVSWIVVAELGGNAMDNFLRLAVTSVISTATLLIPLPRISSGKMLIVCYSYLALSSAWLGWLLYYGQLTQQWVWLIEILAAIITCLVPAANETFLRSISGENQIQVSYQVMLSAWIARTIGGVIFISFALYSIGAWSFLLLDAISYVPYIAMIVVAMRTSEQQDTELSRPKTRALEGMKVILSSPGLVSLVIILLLCEMLFGLSFVLVPNMLAIGLGQGLTALGIWLVCTGMSAFAGNQLRDHVLNRLWALPYLLAITFITIIGIGLCNNVTTFLVSYAAFTLMIGLFWPMVTTSPRAVSSKDVGNVAKALTFVPLILGWLRTGIAKVAAIYDITPGMTLSASALLVALLILPLAVAKRKQIEEVLHAAKSVK